MLLGPWRTPVPPQQPPGEGLLSAEDWARFKAAVARIGASFETGPRPPAADRDGPLVPLSAKPDPARVVPPMALSTYLAMLR